MAVSFTTEQKLIFYLAQNIARLEPSFDAFKISRILVECGVFKENPLLVGERSKEATFVLLKHLFEMLSSRNDARAQQFRIFRLAVGEAGNREILEECLPDLGCSEEELDAHVLRLKDRNDDVAKWLTPDTGSAEELVDSPSIRDGRKTLKLGELTSLECSSILQKILSHHCCDIGTVWQLLASSSFLMDENRILTLGQTLELPIIDVLDEVAVNKGNAAQRGICQEVTRNAEELSVTEASVVHFALSEDGFGLKQRAACGGMLQMIRIGKSWPRNTLNGVSDSSKTTLAKAALGCVGLEGADFNNCTKPVLQQMLAKTTMGFLVDDPKSITLVSEVAVEAFNRSTQGTLKHGFNVPRSSFMITSNSDLQGVAQRVLSRLIVLPFNERLAQSQQEAWQNIAVLLEKASAAIGFSLDTRLGFLRQSS
eukprot:m.266957 g.266957  ORF g.266957 m.266957 type:complete len:426 (+) comp40505_c0_seq52:698-1975(+)